MRLAVHETGTGPRTAVLIHGFMSDSRAWHRVTAELERRGFRVLAVDLAGHGSSPRSRRYSPGAWADDVVETLESLLAGPPDVVMGHSLGGLVASRVAERLSPRTAIYVDPAFGFPGGIRGALVKLLFALSPRPRRTILVKLNPKWDATDLEAELAGLRDWDRRTLLGLADTRLLVPPETLGCAQPRRARREELACPGRSCRHAAGARDDGRDRSRIRACGLPRRIRRFRAPARPLAGPDAAGRALTPKSLAGMTRPATSHGEMETCRSPRAISPPRSRSPVPRSRSRRWSSARWHRMCRTTCLSGSPAT